jgi:hypothetical protein
MNATFTINQRAVKGKIVRGEKEDYAILKHGHKIICVAYAKDFNGHGVQPLDIRKAWRSGLFMQHAAEQVPAIAYITKEDIGDEDRYIWAYVVRDFNSKGELVRLGTNEEANQWIQDNGFLKLS